MHPMHDKRTDMTPEGSQIKHVHHHARVHGYDVIRGIAIISMIGFHLCYDLTMIGSVHLAWFAPPAQDIWRASISWTFLLLAGIMCSYSHNNLIRAAKYFLLAALIFGVTTIADVDTPINFGIIYCMGFSTACAAVLLLIPHFLATPRACRITACFCAIIFILSLDITQHTWGLGAFGGPSIHISSSVYSTEALNWLGFPGAHFSSGDYYPPLPFSLLFMCGVALGQLVKHTYTPDVLATLQCRPLELIGRHPLALYILHQPILLILTGLL